MALVPRDPWHSHPTRYGSFRSRPYSMWPSTPGWYDGHKWPSLQHGHSAWIEASRRRFMEMEKRFEMFMRNVDERFSGMLGLLDFDADPCFPIPVEHDGMRGQPKERAKGKFRIDINVQDFKPEEVTVKVAGGKAQVHAKRETKNEDNGMYAYTFREFRRTFALPDGMRTEDVTSSLTDDGILKIEGPHNVALALEDEIPISVEHESAK